MGENLEPKNVPSPDEGSMAACRSGLSQANSDLSSDLAPGQSVEWTDKRHSSYLESLESSFVKQLHSSLGLLGRSARGNMEMAKRSVNTSFPSEQFNVLRDGCWQRISFQRKRPSLDKIADTHVSIDSPWISRLRPASKHQTSKSDKRCVGRSCHHDCRNAEVSDQNFVDEEKAEESICTSKAKRLKTDTVDSSSNDQIVPNGN